MESIYVSPDDFKTINHRDKIRGLHLLEYFVNRCHQIGVSCEAWIKRGDPKEVICSEVKMVHPDMLVLGCRGLGPFQRAWPRRHCLWVRHRRRPNLVGVSPSGHRRPEHRRCHLDRARPPRICSSRADLAALLRAAAALARPRFRPRSRATLLGRSPPPLQAAAAASVNRGCPDLLGLSQASEVSLRAAAPWTTSTAFSEASATLPVGRCHPSESPSPPPQPADRAKLGRPHPSRGPPPLSPATDVPDLPRPSPGPQLLWNLSQISCGLGWFHRPRRRFQPPSEVSLVFLNSPAPIPGPRVRRRAAGSRPEQACYGQARNRAHLGGLLFRASRASLISMEGSTMIVANC
ncbi:Universal stress protein A-like protein [Ananas comosus]|uniref:Universal stress protein A-like protein n=1 Tax=Ananas comosus TaxID=4615 RepID=A0A199UKQ6_ANACO|nr:Universal stress protein A-like protein [Ananas comosus]